MDNLKLYNKFRAVPKEAQKEITGGRLKGFTDINPMWRIKQLTETYGSCGIGWYTEVVTRELREGANGEVSAFIALNLYVKNDEWSKPIYGEGGSMFVAKERNGMFTSDECFKMAYTDALSIACKSLGMGADIYFAKDRTKYDAQPMEEQIPHQNPPTATITKPIAPQIGNTAVQKSAPNVPPIPEEVLKEIADAQTNDDINKLWKKYVNLRVNPDFKPKLTTRNDEIKNSNGN